MQRSFGRYIAWTGMLWGLAAEASGQMPASLPRPVGGGRGYFLAEFGNDSNDGVQKPWKTLTRANQSVKPGDVVYVFPGHYEGASLKADGTRAAPITYVSVERHKAIIDLGGFAPTPGTVGHRVQINGDYTVFDGFACSTGWDPVKGQDRKGSSANAPAAGIASYRSTGVVLRNNDCFNNDRWGIFTKQVKDMLIENNITRRTRREHGIYHADGSTNCILRGNTSYDNGACGLQLNQSGVDPYVNVLIEGNLFYDNSHNGGQTLNLDGASDVTIRNNVFIVNRRSGIALYKTDGDEPPHDNTIVNNLFLLENGSLGGILTARCGPNSIFNNIFWSAANAPAFNDNGSTLDAQILGYNAGNTRLPGQNNVTLSGKIEELFENPGQRIFRLKAGAPVIDRGVVALGEKRAPETDRDGLKRPQGAGIDIGPYESAGN